MSQYFIYKYDFKKTGEQPLLPSDEEVDDVREKFGEILDARTLSLTIAKKNGESKTYPNDILCRRDGVVVMTVCNVKNVTLIKQYKEVREESNPYCHVVIDNRHYQMAIEKTGAFDGSPNRVRDILVHALRNALCPFGFDVDIRRKMKAQDFWTTIREQTITHKDTVSKVEFEFAPAAAPVDDASERMRILMSIAQGMGGAKASFQVDASENGTLKIDEVSEDMVNMVSLCSNNAYNINVHFRNMGVYRCGDEIAACFRLGDDVVNDFVAGQRIIGANGEPTFALLDWLEDVRQSTQRYDYETQAQPGRRRRRQM